MARIFLDTNAYINTTKEEKEKWENLDAHLLFISPLSTHILFYVRKFKVPHKEINQLHENFEFMPLTKHILDKALEGPTSDLEDNVQLHSAAEAECDIFLTSDKTLLRMKFFGKMKIKSPEDFS